MTTKDAITRLEIIATNLCGQSAQNQNLWPDYKAVDMAISAIRAKQEREHPQPLTIDELRQMDGEPVWVVCDDLVLCALVEVCEESIFLTNNLGGRTGYDSDVELEEDGIIIYSHKPEEEPK